MKLTCTEPNYAATVMRIHNTIKLDGLDNLVGIPAFGNMALITKDHEVGQLGVVFTAETKLSEKFCHENNLFRKAEMNKDQTKTGYLEEKGRVRALKLRGNVSTALFLPLSSLSYLGVNPEDFKEGDTFNEINGEKVCEKYIVITPEMRRANKVKGTTKKFNRVDAVHFPEHVDTDNYWKNKHKLKDDDWIVVSQKLHGTSARFANTIVKRKLSWIEKIAKFFGVKVQETEYDTVAGSRRVIKDIKGDTKFDHFYDTDIWNHHLERVQHIIPKGFIIYGEIIGWVGDSPIQKNYTYQIPKGESEFYVYRISTINESGISVDLTWGQMVEFCKNNGLKHVTKVWEGPHKDFDESIYMDQKFVKDLGLRDCLPLDNTAECDEGVCIWVDGLKGYILKAKSPLFLLGETKLLDAGIVDTETQESIV